MARDVIMPALGMTQKSGVILAWRKDQGDAVKKGDILFEVETDKSVMEVEAMADGILCDVRAGEGDDVPVGVVIANIAPSDVSSCGEDESSPPESSAPSAPPRPAALHRPAAPEKPREGVPARPDVPAPPASGKILASPKARRLAQQKGLDLARLARPADSRPFRARDIERLAAMPAPAPGPMSSPGPGQPVHVARARVPAESFDSFTAWLAREQAGISASAVFAAFAAGALRPLIAAHVIAVEIITARAGKVVYVNPDRSGLGALVPASQVQEPSSADRSSPANLIICDLTASHLADAQLAAPATPTFTIARDGDTLSVTLSAAMPGEGQLLSLLDAFAARLDMPLRHLL